MDGAHEKGSVVFPVELLAELAEVARPPGETHSDLLQANRRRSRPASVRTVLWSLRCRELI